jgi:hypothetical protein
MWKYGHAPREFKNLDSIIQGASVNTTSILTIYVLGTAVTALGVYAERRLVRDDGSLAADNLAWVTVLAGLVWPVVLLGAVQFGALLALRGLMRWISPVAPHDVFATFELQMSQFSQAGAGATPDMDVTTDRFVRAA